MKAKVLQRILDNIYYGNAKRTKENVNVRIVMRSGDFWSFPFNFEEGLNADYAQDLNDGILTLEEPTNGNGEELGHGWLDITEIESISL